MCDWPKNVDCQGGVTTASTPATTGNDFDYGYNYEEEVNNDYSIHGNSNSRLSVEAGRSVDSNTDSNILGFFRPDINSNSDKADEPNVKNSHQSLQYGGSNGSDALGVPRPDINSNYDTTEESNVENSHQSVETEGSVDSISGRQLNGDVSSERGKGVDPSFGESLRQRKTHDRVSENIRRTGDDVGSDSAPHSCPEPNGLFPHPDVSEQCDSV